MDTVNNSSSGDSGRMAAGSALANISGPDGIELRATAFRANEAMGVPLPELFLLGGGLGVITSYEFLGQHRTIWQEHSAKDFASYESYKRGREYCMYFPLL